MSWFKSKPETERPLPLERTFDRELAEDFEGRAYTWDVDNTYLRTDLHSLRAMLAVPFENAWDKRSFPGVPELLQEIRKGTGAESSETPIFFVSASPVQLRSVLEKRMLLDGIQQDGFTLRDWGSLARADFNPIKFFKKLKDPVTYKLMALILNRRDFPVGVKEFLFGDNTEHDASIYSIYADMMCGKLRGKDLETEIRAVSDEDPAPVVAMAEDMPCLDVVEGIFIHRARKKKKPKGRLDYERVVVFDNYYEAARLLADRGQISQSGLMRVEKAVFEAGIELGNTPEP